MEKLKSKNQKLKTTRSKIASRVRRDKNEEMLNDQMSKSPPLEAYAVGRYLKISPTKVRGVLDLIRGETVAEAKRILRFSPKKGAKIALKVLNSAVANIGAKGQFDEKSWIISDARADKGPIFRRKLDPKARGARGTIATPSTHLTIKIREKVTEATKVTKVKKNEKMVSEKINKLPTKPRLAGRKEAKGGS